MKIRFKQWLHPQMGVVPVDPKTPLVLEAEIEREWVGFTEDEINEYDYEYRDFIYDIEALLKHKNTRLG